METDIKRLQELLRRAYEKLSDCEDQFAGGDGWKSKEMLQIMDEIADAINLEAKDRY